MRVHYMQLIAYILRQTTGFIHISLKKMDKYQTVIWSFKRQQTSPRQPVRKFSATYISFYLNTKKQAKKPVTSSTSIEKLILFLIV